MGGTITMLDSEVTVRVFSVLAHSLWQAPLLALGTWIILRWLPAREAELRYRLCLAALALTVMVSAGTWTLTGEPSQEVAVTSSVPGEGDAAPEGMSDIADGSPIAAVPVGGTAGSLGRDAARTGNWQAAIVMAWLIGVGLMLVRVSLAMHQTIVLAVDGPSVPEEIVQILREQCVDSTVVGLTGEGATCVRGS